MSKNNNVKIYCYTNKINGKKYIGQTCDTLTNRAGKYGKKYASSTKFFNAILRYGWGNFEPTILEITTKELADEREKYWIKQFDSVRNGYNLSFGGKANHIFSQETRDRVKKSMEEYGSWFKDKHHTEEARKKMSDRTKQWIAENGHPLKGKTGELAPMYGKHHSKETRQKLSIMHLGEKNPMFGVESPFKGRKHTEEAKQKSKLAKAFIVYLKNVETGEVFTFIGAKDAAKFINMSESTINIYAKQDKPIRGFKVEYGGKCNENRI